MPKIEPTNRVQPVADESAYRAPKKTITQATGMDPSLSVSGAIQNRQPVTTEETKEPAKEVTLSPQLTALARKEAKIRQQEQEFKAEKGKFEAERAEVSKLAAIKAKVDAKDYSVLDEMGISYEEWTKYLIEKGDSEKPEAQALKKLESKVESIEKANQENINKQYEATLNQYRREIKQLVESNPEFDSIKSQKAEEHVLQHIVETFNEDGETLTVERAAKEIEDFIIEEAIELSKLKRVQEKLKPAVEEKTLPPPRSTFKTLTNQVTQATPSGGRNQFQHMTMKDRIAAAVARTQK